MRQPLTPKEKIDRAAYTLFSRHGIHSVGVDTIAARSGVAKMTLYRHYPSKDALAPAFFERRFERFSRSWQAQVEALRLPPREALLAIFDVLEDWYRSPGYTGCPVVKAVLESKSDAAVYGGALRYFASVRGFLRKLAKQAGVRDPDILAAQWHLLVWGSIVGARAKDRNAARRAREIGAAILGASSDKPFSPSLRRFRTLRRRRQAAENPGQAPSANKKKNGTRRRVNGV